MKKLFYLVAVFLASCATVTPPPTRVEVPVAIACIQPSRVPARPAYESPELPPPTEANKLLYIAALTRDWLRSRPYEAKLEALVTACTDKEKAK